MKCEGGGAVQATSNQDLLGLRTAVSFLTILPVDPGRDPVLGRAVPWFPAVGLVVAVLAVGLDLFLASGGLSGEVRAVLTVVVITVVTGMLHLDGFMDTCDGLASQQRGPAMLKIMRDSRVGAAGAAGGFAALLLWYVLLSQFISHSGRAMALLQALVIGRVVIVVSAAAVRSHHTSGLGFMFGKCLTGGRVTLAVVFGTLIVWAVLAAGTLWGDGNALELALRTAYAMAAGLVAGMAVAVGVSRRLGGLTGDVLGAVCIVSELAVLLALSAGGR